MRLHKHVQGHNTEEQIASIDGLLNSILVKPRKEVTQLFFSTPFCVCLDQSEVGRGFFTIPGTIANIGIDVGSCEKDTELVIQLMSAEVTTTKRFKVKKGLTKIDASLPVIAFTKLSVMFSLPVIDGHIGYTFTPDRSANATETIPA